MLFLSHLIPGIKYATDAINKTCKKSQVDDDDDDYDTEEEDTSSSDEIETQWYWGDEYLGSTYRDDDDE